MKDFQSLSNFFKKFYIVFPLTFFAVFFLLLFLNYYLEFLSFKDRTFQPPIKDFKASAYPVIKTDFVPKISALGAVVLDASSGVVLYQKNMTLRFSPASTTKVMTALTALSYFNLNDILTVKTATREGSIIGLYQGERLRFEDLLYGMLLPSGNDAALVISENYKGGKDNFIKMMNQNAKRWYLFNTYYQDPAGLLDDFDYITPFDLARLAKIALGNSEFMTVVSTKEKIIKDLDGNSYDVSNLNKLLGIDGVYGIKTGYTEAAGQVLVVSKMEKGHTIILVVMGSQDRFLDTQILLDLVSNNLTYLPIRE
jgi:D-alanyl-D-alanine carboxypeptidase (penicillin-binding protein 5/6)